MRGWLGTAALFALACGSSSEDVGRDAGVALPRDGEVSRALDGAAEDADLPQEDAGVERDADAASPPDAPAPEVDAATPVGLPYYEVPMDDPARAAHALFAVDDVDYDIRDGEATLAYDFPEELSGIRNQEVVFTGPVDALGNGRLVGPDGTADCSVTAGVVRCHEVFAPSFQRDPAIASAAAEDYSTDPSSRAARIDVIEAFASDPIGVLYFEPDDRD